MYGINWHTNQSGNLVITREDEEAPRDIGEALEALTANDSYDWLRPEELGALTDAPLLGYETERTDSGALVSVARVYWYPRYETRDPLADLAAGALVFELAPEE